MSLSSGKALAQALKNSTILGTPQSRIGDKLESGHRLTFSRVLIEQHLVRPHAVLPLEKL